MYQNVLNRRSFLRLLMVSAAAQAAAACGQATPDPIPTSAGAETLPPSPSPTLPPTPAPEAAGQVVLAGRDGDIWAWSEPVKAQVTQIEDCEKLAIYVNGLEIEAAAAGDSFSAEVPLFEGENRVQAACTRSGGQEVRSNMVHYHERLRRAPVAVINLPMDGERVFLDGSQSQPAEEAGPRLVDYIWTVRAGNPAPLTLQGLGRMEDREFTGPVSGQTISILPPTVDGEYYLSLQVKDELGREDTSTTYFVVENGQARLPDYDRENPAWVESAIVYGVIPFKFGDPAFKAITNRLDYLADLGVNALWLAPVNLSPADDYGYAVIDYFELNPSYGTKENFHRMVQEAHARGIRVLMDFVPNHSSVEHAYYRDALEHGQDSHYWDFYDRDENGESTHYFEWTHLPNLNYENPEVRRMMIEAFAYWVREFDVDGFRVDVAWGVTERRPDFWPEWRRALKRIKPDLLLLAEASARDPYYFDNGFDAAYDWTNQLGQWAWKLVWDSFQNTMLSYNLNDALINHPDGFHPDALIFRFLNNNDTGERFITRHGEGMTRVSTALLLTLPGIPCIYTGDENGAEYHPYETLGPMAWVEQVPGLRDYHKKLIALRKTVPSLHSRLWQPIEVMPIRERQVYAYLRYQEPAEQPVLVLLNFSEEPAEMAFELPAEFQAMLARGSLYDLLSDETVSFNGTDTVRLNVPGLTARILAAET